MNSGSARYAGFWRRLAAFILDSVLFGALTAPLLYAVYGTAYFRFAAAQGGVDILVTKLLPFVLLIGFWSILGATPGKVLMDCRVVDAASGGPLSLRQAFLRAFGYLVSMLPLYLGFLWIAWDSRKQGFHDKIAGTVVLHRADDYAQTSLQVLQRPWR